MIDRTQARQWDKGGLIACMVFLLLGAVIWWVSADYSPLGSVFPRTIATLMMLLSVLYIILRARKSVPVQAEAGGSVLRRASMFAIMLLWALAFTHIGFLVTSLICFALVLVVANYDRWTLRSMAVYAVSGVVIIGVLYVLFKEILQVPLPAGMLL